MAMDMMVIDEALTVTHTMAAMEAAMAEVITTMATGVHTAVDTVESVTAADIIRIKTCAQMQQLLF